MKHETTLISVGSEDRIHPLMVLKSSAVAMNTLMDKDGEQVDPTVSPVVIVNGRGFNQEDQEAILFVPDSKAAAELSEVILFMLLDEEGVDRVMTSIHTEVSRMRDGGIVPYIFQEYSGDSIEMWPEGEEDE